MATISLGPVQERITLERVREVLNWQPRRMVIGGPNWSEPLREPSGPDKDWSLVLPFCETLKNAFEHGCLAKSIGIRRSKERCWTYLTGTAGHKRSELREVVDWLDTVGRYVAIRDGLCMSFALGFDRINGDPNQNQTRVGQLRARAKPYGKRADSDALDAADELVAEMMAFLEVMSAYGVADAIVAMPPSDPDKPFDLPTYMAENIAGQWGRDNLSEHIRTISVRKQIKDVPLAEKVDLLNGTIGADPEAFRDRSVLLIDDLYQSGASANMAALELIGAGAKRVLGLFCEKTCRNDDNVR